MRTFALLLAVVMAGCDAPATPLPDAGAPDTGPEACAPTIERCDGMLDEDCDGLVDEGCDCTDGRARACGSDVGACQPGLETCVDGAWGACTGGTLPSAESCDGLADDDCDGVIDEECACTDGSARSCGAETGSCVAGTETCAAGAWGACLGLLGPSEERCDGVEDENCDGVVDEGCACTTGASRTCGSDVGRCAPGAQSCTEGAWTECVGATAPIAERCDGVDDDDCDGRVDEGCGCIDGTSRPCGTDVGACAAGTQTCTTGAWGACTGAIGPRTETCDGALDEDCDGTRDEGCPPCTPTWRTVVVDTPAAGGTNPDPRFSFGMTLRADDSLFLLYKRSRPGLPEDIVRRTRPVDGAWSARSTVVDPETWSAIHDVVFDEVRGGVHYTYVSHGVERHGRYGTDGAIPEGAIRMDSWGTGLTRLAIIPSSGFLTFVALDPQTEWRGGDLSATDWAPGSASADFPQVLESIAVGTFDIAVDPDGGTHVTYNLVMTGPDYFPMFHAYRAPGTYAFVTRPIGEGQVLRLEVDDGGALHLVYLTPSYGLGYGRRAPGGAWAHETVAPAPHGWGASLAIDAAGEVHLSTVRHYPYYDLHYWHRDPSLGWRGELVDDSSLLDYRQTALAVDGAGRTHVVYASMETGELRHAERVVCP